MGIPVAAAIVVGLTCSFIQSLGTSLSHHPVASSLDV